ncbi:MAG: class I SAM-dependent methyltransferase [Nitrospirota bacterium]|nr:class I SAM-dependent methyltransferase [Nitrospirota bacterium]
MPNPKCRICGSPDGHEHYRIPELMFGTKELFSYFQCGTCGCLQIEEIPTDMSRYYPDNYYSFSSSPPGKSIVRRLSDRLRLARDRAVVFGRGRRNSLSGRILRKSKYFYLADLHLSPSARILDVGCGSGGRLSYLREMGLTNVSGIDPYIPQDIDRGGGLWILKKNVHDISGAWDVVMYNHSFEHVPDPREQLQSVYRILAPGGACIIRIPTVSSFAWEHYREYWYQVDAPRHLIIPSTDTMKFLAKTAGLILEKVEFDSTFEQFRVSECYKKGIVFGKAKDVFPKKQIRQWKKQTKELNRLQRGDQAVFTLKKE